MTTYTLRYEIRDRHHEDWRGHRFADLERARREMVWAEPKDRFYLYDRDEKREIT